MAFEERYQALVMLVRGSASGKVILPFVVVNFRCATMAIQPLGKPARHFDRPDLISRTMTEEQGAVESLDFYGGGGKKLIGGAAPRPSALASVP